MLMHNLYFCCLHVLVYINDYYTLRSSQKYPFVLSCHILFSVTSNHILISDFSHLQFVSTLLPHSGSQTTSASENFRPNF